MECKISMYNSYKSYNMKKKSSKIVDKKIVENIDTRTQDEIDASEFLSPLNPLRNRTLILQKILEELDKIQTIK